MQPRQSKWLWLSVAAIAVVPQVAPAQSWATTAWRVTEVTGTLGPERVGFLTNQLEQSTAWLESLGFREPRIIYRRDQAGTRRLDAFYDASLTSSCGNVTAHYDTHRQAVYFATALFEPFGMVLDTAGLHDNHVGRNEGNLLAPVHEIFHGVQYGYRRQWPTQLDWFLESSAEAVRYAWGERTYGPIDLFERQSYDEPLHEPFIGAGCRTNSEVYRTGHFWFHLGGDIGSTDRVGFLADIFDKLAGDPTADAARRGLGPIADALKGVDGGLYHLYPQFIARHAADSSNYRYERLVDLSPANLQVIDRTHELQPTKGLASSAWFLTVRVPSGTTAGLTIRLTRDHPDLHLIVDTTRFDRPARREERNAFRTAIVGSTDTLRFLVRVANVAEEAEKSGDRSYTIEFRLAEVATCDPRQLWAAVHPSAQALLTPPQNQQQVTPGSEPAVGELHIQGLLGDGGSACTHAITVSANPSKPDVNMGLRLQQRVSQMSPQEMQAMAQRMAARMQQGKRPTPEDIVNAVRADSIVDSLVTMSSLIRVFSPNAIFGQRGDQPVTPGLQSLGAYAAMYAQDNPVVAWQHGGVGGWQPNSGGQAVVVIPDVAPEGLREDTTYSAVGAMQYSRGEGVLKQQRSATNARSDEAWQGLEGWIEQVSSAADVTPYALKGTVRIQRITGASIEGTFDLTGMGEYERAECPKNPGNLASVSRQCRVDKRSGAVSITGRFVAPAVRTIHQ